MEVLDKYERAEGLLGSIYKTQMSIRHRVDCRSLHTYTWERSPFTKVAFIFPHVGGSKKEDIKLNQQLLLCFFDSARDVLTEKGQVCIALRTTSFYRSWGIEELAERCGYTLESVSDFEAEQYKGYGAQRTNPAVRDAPQTDGAQMYVFERIELSEERERERAEEKKKQLEEREEKKEEKDELFRLIREQKAGKRKKKSGVEVESTPTEPEPTKKKKGNKYAQSAGFTCKKCSQSFTDRKKYDRHIDSSTC